MKVKLIVDLKDAYGEIYHDKGDVVEVEKRSIETEPDTMTVGHLKKFPYSCGWFYINETHFERKTKKSLTKKR